MYTFVSIVDTKTPEGVYQIGNEGTVDKHKRPHSALSLAVPSAFSPSNLRDSGRRSLSAMGGKGRGPMVISTSITFLVRGMVKPLTGSSVAPLNLPDDSESSKISHPVPHLEEGQ